MADFEFRTGELLFELSKPETCSDEGLAIIDQTLILVSTQKEWTRVEEGSEESRDSENPQNELSKPETCSGEGKLISVSTQEEWTSVEQPQNELSKPETCSGEGLVITDEKLISVSTQEKWTRVEEGSEESENPQNELSKPETCGDEGLSITDETLISVSTREESTSVGGSKESEKPQNGCLMDKRDPEQRNFSLRYAAAMLSHPAKAANGGEDAFLLEGSWIGVADGVGGWVVFGIDAGLYSRELMRNCKALASETKGKPDPKSVLSQAVSSTTARGSATVLVAALFAKTLYAANFGDTGFIVVRDSKVVARSYPMLHGFNRPFQVGDDGDDPSLAEMYAVPVCKGDIIVLGTDGLFDNLFERQILEVLKETLGAGFGVKDAAASLVKSARIVGRSYDKEQQLWYPCFEQHGSSLEAHTTYYEVSSLIFVADRQTEELTL